MSDERRAHGSGLARHLAGHQIYGPMHDGPRAQFHDDAHVHTLAHGGARAHESSDGSAHKEQNRALSNDHDNVTQYHPHGYESGNRHDQKSDEQHAHGSGLAQHRVVNRICGLRHGGPRAQPHDDIHAHTLVHDGAHVHESNDESAHKVQCHDAQSDHYDIWAQYHLHAPVNESQHDRMSDVQHVHGNVPAQHLAGHRIYDLEHDGPHAQLCDHVRMNDDRHSHLIPTSHDGQEKRDVQQREISQYDVQQAYNEPQNRGEQCRDALAHDGRQLSGGQLFDDHQQRQLSKRHVLHSNLASKYHYIKTAHMLADGNTHQHCCELQNAHSVFDQSRGDIRVVLGSL